MEAEELKLQEAQRRRDLLNKVTSHPTVSIDVSSVLASLNKEVQQSVKTDWSVF